MNNIRRFRASLRALVRELDESLNTKTDCCGITTAQCHLLLEVTENGEGSIGEYADRLYLDQSTLSRTVDNLVKVGYIEREPDPENRRRQLIKATQTGEKKAASINELCDNEYGQVLARIPKAKQAELFDELDLLIKAFREEKSLAASKENKND